MEINLLVLNGGNSRLALGVFVAGNLEYSARVALDSPMDLESRIGEAWSRIQNRDHAAIAAATVNDRIIAPLENAVRSATRKQIEWVGKELDLPIKVLTENPQQTGVDRVLNIAAAYEQMQKACVVVDAGTAITVDCCNDKGEFLGGAIAPGVAMQLDSLHEGTSRLPRVDLQIPSEIFGRSTEEAIRHGVYHGVRGMVKELVESYATSLGFWPDIIATGGDAPALFEDWELIHAISPDLTLYGIALAYAEHHIRHNT